MNKGVLEVIQLAAAWMYGNAPFRNRGHSGEYPAHQYHNPACTIGLRTSS